MYTFIHMYTCAHTYIYIHIHIYTYIYICTHIYKYIHIYLNIHVWGILMRCFLKSPPSKLCRLDFFRAMQHPPRALLLCSHTSTHIPLPTVQQWQTCLGPKWSQNTMKDVRISSQTTTRPCRKSMYRESNAQNMKHGRVEICVVCLNTHYDDTQ